MTLPETSLAPRCPSGCNSTPALQVIDYPTETKHDGRLHKFTVHNLRIFICPECKTKIFTVDTDLQETEALRTHLGLMSPGEIRKRLNDLGLSQREFARRIGVAEETLSRWLNTVQIQNRAMDNLMRLFFDVPEARRMLT